VHGRDGGMAYRMRGSREDCHLRTLRWKVRIDEESEFSGGKMLPPTTQLDFQKVMYVARIGMQILPIATVALTDHKLRVSVFLILCHFSEPRCE